MGFCCLFLNCRFHWTVENYLIHVACVWIQWEELGALILFKYIVIACVRIQWEELFCLRFTLKYILCGVVISMKCSLWLNLIMCLLWISCGKYFGGRYRVLNRYQYINLICLLLFDMLEVILSNVYCLIKLCA